MCYCSETTVEVQKQLLGCWQRCRAGSEVGGSSLPRIGWSGEFYRDGTCHRVPLGLDALVGLACPPICELAGQPLVVWGTTCCVPPLPAGGLQDARPALGDGQSCASHHVEAFGVGQVSKMDPAAWTQRSSS